MYQFSTTAPLRGTNIPADSFYTPYCQALDAELREAFSSREGFLYQLLRYQLGWTDQQGHPENRRQVPRLQSVLPLVVCQALTDGYGAALPVAAAVELIHHFTLVHGDVQAGRMDAESRPGIWWVWGPAQAINAGDGLHAMGRATIMRLARQGVPPDQVVRAMGALDQACLALCEGQYMDLTFQDQLMVTSADYFDMIGRKTGALCGCAAQLGALVAGCDESTQTRFQVVGTKLGMALQITEDIADLWGKAADGVTPGNLLNKKKSLPLIHALENSTTAIKRELTGIYMKRVLDPNDVSRIIAVLDESQAKEYAEEKAREIASEAMELAATSGVPSEKMAPLERLARWALGKDA